MGMEGRQPVAFRGTEAVYLERKWTVSMMFSLPARLR